MKGTVAYVLVRARPGNAIAAARVIAKIPGVLAADAVTGVYDVICRVQADSLEGLAATVVDRIQAVEAVERTETALVVHAG